ncbi:MAG: fused MFS/spermidine synthase [Verrucomicrobia bacterium]|nr:fused MFS/spermidine synthase [Verrucomicrobiota bacterium]
MLKFASTVFAGAFLLFAVQPLIGKYILPWFGGTPAVWTICMLFFQVLLLGGYAYAHVSTSRLSPRRQAVLHLALLAGAVALLPITPSDAWKPQDSSHPALRILALLAASIGWPYFVLSATGPLMQEWFRRTHPGRSPFRLYAVSNLGSLLALVSYPFWFEHQFSRKTQAACWSWGMLAFVLLCGFCAVWFWRRNPVASAGPDSAPAEAVIRPAIGRRLLWLALPACASVLLLATTNKLCQDVAVIPFLWVLPLGLYLLTFIVCFDSPRWYSRVAFGVLLVPAVAASCWTLARTDDVPLVNQVVIYSAVLFVGCMVCHGELYRLKPHPRFLTSFYLMIAVGGALGGGFVAVMAPLIFDTYAELPWSLGACLLLFLIVCALDKGGLAPSGWRVFGLLCSLLAGVALDRTWVWFTGWLKAHQERLHWSFPANPSWRYVEQLHWVIWLGVAGLVVRAFLKRHSARPRRWHLITCALLGAALWWIGATLWTQSWRARQGALSLARNFYGVLSVREYERADPDKHYLVLQHGRITHGLQFVEPASARWPTTYYGENSGIGLALRHASRQQDRVIGVVGLGTGTLAAYGKKGDRLRFYEINPEVQRLAQERFTYLKQCPARVEVVLGDARLSLEREPPQQFDVLALDAFSSDAIPVHLLTREAVEIYLRHLKPDGVLAVHISNQYLNLAPVVDRLASHFQLQLASISESDDLSEEETEWWHYASTWVLLTRNEEFLRQPALREARSEPGAKTKTIPLWTDDYASLFPLLQ